MRGMSMLLLLLALGVATPVQAGDAAIHLSWHAPYGLPGADSSLVRACGDTTLVDTLYLSFDPGRDCSTFVAVTATLWFRALAGDSLEAMWQASRGHGLPRGIKLEFGPGPSSPHPFPWESSAMAHFSYLRPSETAGRLRILYSVPPDAGAQVEGGRLYSLARLLLRRPSAGTPGCDQPVCVEWGVATMAYSVKDEPTVTAGFRYAGINLIASPQGCRLPPAASSRGSEGARKPKKPTRPGGNPPGG